MSANLMLAYTAFVIGVASPGPSTLAVMGVAMARGRARALALAFSTGAARRGYRAVERPVNALLAGVFTYAGLRMLMSSR